MSMSDELDLEFELQKLVENGTEAQKFEFVMNNLFALAEMMNICVHCVAEEALNQIEQQENETCH